MDMDPDRLETWYVGDCNAEAGAETARQGEERGVSSSSITECTQRAWPCGGGWEDLQAAVKTAVGTKRVPSVLELLAAGGKGPSQSEGAKPQEVVASSGGESRSIEKIVAVIAGAEAAAEKATANGPSQYEGAKPQEDFATSEGESRSLEKTVAEIAAAEKATAKGLGSEDSVGQKGGVSEAGVRFKHGLIKTLEGAGLGANPEGGWTPAKPQHPPKDGAGAKADILEKIEAETLARIMPEIRKFAEIEGLHQPDSVVLAEHFMACLNGPTKELLKELVGEDEAMSLVIRVFKEERAEGAKDPPKGQQNEEKNQKRRERFC